MLERLLCVIPLAAGLAGLPGLAAAQPAPCFDVTAPLTVEEQRLDDVLAPGRPAVGPELVRLGGLAGVVERFTERLCRTERGRADVVTRAGQELWRTAVERRSADDRPLYWARLQATKALRQWRPRTGLTDVERAHLLRRLDHAARGLDDIRFADGVRRVAVTGFDPFQLDGTAVRRSNPSGAAALLLDGQVLDTPRGRVVVEAAVLPVLWGAFDQGVVERFYGTALAARSSAVVTVSQGRPGRFDVERWAGRWRGGSPDNNGIGVRGPVPAAPGWPQPALEFIETTLPAQRMVDVGGPYPVLFNREFCEWPLGTPPGEGTPSCRTDEPTPGAAAAAGSGGNYLSNESMYRANRLRLGLGADRVLGGHLHTPVLGLPAGPTDLTDRVFEEDRRRIADQVVALVAVV